MAPKKARVESTDIELKCHHSERAKINVAGFIAELTKKLEDWMHQFWNLQQVGIDLRDVFIALENEGVEGVHFEHAWLDPESGKAFCLSTGPSKEAIMRVHEKSGIPTTEVYEIARLAEDIAGGLMVTMPSEKDLENPATAAVVKKYFQGVASVPTEVRMRILRLIENLTLGTAAVGYRTESMHGAGSPQAQRIMIARQGGLAAKKELAKNIAGID